ncbi:DgyrCDS10800 [Dimorphilus gyrociliatus]|nr:DgyrCDS10800 [Dimorphilus gyrociliatus]
MPEPVTRAKGLITIPDQDKLMQRYIMQSHWWDPTKEKLAKRKTDLVLWRYKAEFGIPPEKMTSIFLRNLVRLLNLSGSEHKQFIDERRTTYQHHVSAQYPFQDNTIWTRFVSEVAVSGEDPLPRFTSSENVHKTIDDKLPDIYPISPMVDLKRQHIWRIENNTGWISNFNYQAPHIIFINNNNKGIYEHTDSWKIGQNNARALMTCMAHATAFAKFQYGTDVKILPQPICVQAVHSDSVNLNFVFFQLNTLDLTSVETGIKNQVWFDSNNALIERHEPKRSMLRNTRLLNYDPEVLRKMLAVYAYGMLDGSEKSRIASKN